MADITAHQQQQLLPCFVFLERNTINKSLKTSQAQPPLWHPDSINLNISQDVCIKHFKAKFGSRHRANPESFQPSKFSMNHTQQLKQWGPSSRLRGKIGNIIGIQIQCIGGVLVSGRSLHPLWQSLNILWLSTSPLISSHQVTKL